MDYAQAVAYLYDRLPVFHRVGAKALKPGLGNTVALCAALGDPQHQFRSIHVAGTNGKGSTSHMLASVYQAAGYKVGLYTSPHLKSFTERIRINGQPIPDASVAAFVTTHRALIEQIEPSFFEVTVAIAFDYFARETVDVAIIEVGLGGRLDSTNVITPLLSVITNIGLDHTDILGDTLPEIAREKAGIIKPGVPVVIGETQPEVASVFNEKAADCQSVIYVADQVCRVQDGGLKQGRREAIVQTHGQPNDWRSTLSGGRYSLDLAGAYQLRNLPAVLVSLARLQPVLPVSEEAIRQGLAAVLVSTGLKGRFQTLQQHPWVVADTAHNQPGMLALLDTLGQLTYHKLHLIIGFVQDKDVAAVLRLMPTQATYYFCQSHTPRSLPADALARLAQASGLFVAEAENAPVFSREIVDKQQLSLLNTYTDVNQALADALDRAAADDLILITGSTYLVAELTDL